METLTCKRSDTLSCQFFFIENGEPANLSGCTARMQIREFSKDGTGAVLVEGSTDDYLSIDVDHGAVIAKIPGSMMNFVTPSGRNALSDIELTYSDGRVLSSDTFKVKVVADETRDS